MADIVWEISIVDFLRIVGTSESETTEILNLEERSQWVESLA